MFKSLARSAALGIVAAGAGAAGVGVGAFALFAGLKDPIGQAGAAAVVAALFLLVALGAALLMRGGGHKDEAQPKSSSPLAALTGGGDIKDRAIAFAKQRPLIAGGVGLLGAFYVLRNPALVTGLLGLVAGRQEGRQEIRRGWF